MREDKIDLIWLITSIGGFVLMSTSFLLMPLDKTAELYDTMDIIPGVMFWLFLIVGIAGQIMLCIRRKRFLESDRRKRFQARKGRVGLFNVFKNIPAIVVDVGFILSLVALVITTMVTHGMGYLCYILLAVCVFCFCAHCIFNGKIFNYMIEKNKHSLRKREGKGNDKSKE